LPDPQIITHDWSDNDLFRKHLDAAVEYVGASFRDKASRSAKFYQTQSPIEALFVLWWDALGRSDTISRSMIELHKQHTVVANGSTYRLDFALMPESPLCYRARPLGVAIPMVAVELDGHDFHEKTREQVTYRNQRDRDLIAAGWKVIHFSGSEMNRQPDQCVEDAFALALSGFFEFETRLFGAECEATKAGTTT